MMRRNVRRYVTQIDPFNTVRSTNVVARLCVCARQEEEEAVSENEVNDMSDAEGVAVEP
jgi:hypothetical protein